MKCTFVAHSAGISPFSHQAGAIGFAICLCTTHNFNLGQVSATAVAICPIGQIEAARDQALEAIAAAQAPEQYDGK